VLESIYDENKSSDSVDRAMGGREVSSSRRRGQTEPTEESVGGGAIGLGTDGSPAQDRLESTKVIDQTDIKEVFDAVKEALEDFETSMQQYLRQIPRESESVFLTPQTKEITQSEDTDEELLMEMEDALDDLGDGVQALQVAVGSVLEEERKKNG
jgi:hypothetical protein